MNDFKAVVRQLDRFCDDVLSRFKTLGGSRDRWNRQDQLRMAQAITEVEDELELFLHGNKSVARQKLQSARRRLEDVRS